MDLDQTARYALGIFAKCGAEPLTAVRLARALDIAVPESQACLAHLELLGLISRPADSRYPFFHLTAAAYPIVFPAHHVEATLDPAARSRSAPAQSDSAVSGMEIAGQTGGRSPHCTPWASILGSAA